MELKLVGVARASLEELLGDYKDFLRQRGLPQWGKDHPMSVVIRRMAYARNRSYQTYASHIEFAPPEVAANTMLCLVHQTNYLIDQQLRQLEEAFLQQGGFTERLYQARQQARAVPPRPSFSRRRDPPPPATSASPKPHPSQPAAPASAPATSSALPNSSYPSNALRPKTRAPNPKPE